jgi:hypothetical protein
MNKKRLLKLADLLEADAKNKKGIKFDLDYIAVKADVHPTKEMTYKPGEVVALDCGTAACAIGLACISGAFKRSGLTYRVDEYWGVEPVYGEHDGWGNAERAFFGLSDGEVEFLFQTWSYPHGKTKGAEGERYVAKRIRNFVAGKVAPPQGEEW